MDQKKKSACVVPGYSSASQRGCGRGLPLSEISVVYVIVERQKMLALMEVYCYVDSVVHCHCNPDDDALCGARRKHRAKGHGLSLNPSPLKRCCVRLEVLNSPSLTVWYVQRVTCSVRVG